MLDLFNIARNIIVQLPTSSFSLSTSLRCIHIVVWIWPVLGKNCVFLSDRSDFHMTVNLSIALHAPPISVLMSLSVDEMLLSRYLNLSSSSREPLFSVEKSPFFSCVHIKVYIYIYPTPPLGKDMTQGQFLRGV